MYGKYKVVACTAAGRRRYMQYLMPYVLGDDVVDRYDIWVNTTDMQDIEFFRQMAACQPKVRLVWQPDGVVRGIASINRFYRDCTEQDTIYIKVDDDVVWMERGTLGRLAAFRVAHPEAFVVSPMVVNNAICSYIWQAMGVVSFGRYYNAACNHRVMWKRGQFALALHRWFLAGMNAGADFAKRLHVGPRPVACNRFSINLVAWFGTDFAKFGGVVEGDDEEFISCTRPAAEGRVCLFDGDNVVAHFAFASQRDVLDGAGILEAYGDYVGRELADDAVWADVRRCMADVEARAAEIAAKPCPYTVPPTTAKQRLRRAFKKCQKSLRNYVERNIDYPVEGPQAGR